MYEWRKANVTGNFRKAFEVANDIAWTFDDKKVRTAYVLFAALYDEECCLSEQLTGLEGVRLVPALECFFNDRTIFTDVFGEKAATKFFDEKQQEEAGLISKADLGLPDDEITDRVISALNGIFAAEQSEEMPEIMEPNYSDKLEEACDEAWEYCRASNKDCLDLDTLVYCLISRENTSAHKFMKGLLTSMEVNFEELIESLRREANITALQAEDTVRKVVIPTTLESCLESLNDKYTKDDECVILGRDKEIFKVFNVFSKKTKRNCVLVGKPGVGKTAIIEAITQKIVSGTCPDEFKKYTVLSLDVISMIAGTMYRGQFETKVAVLKQFLEKTPNVILFVDEMHQMLGAGGSSDGTVDLSGSLKPILSRDDVVFVGATTVKEYDQILSRDGAFKRRFEVINVREPKKHEIKPMIEAKLRSMEKYHGAGIPSELVDYIILCSSCFNSETCNPDKTLDLCDRSMAIAKMNGNKTVNKEDVNMVYEEYFKMHDSYSKTDIRNIAYHEIGHYIVTRFTKEREGTDVKAISVIPGDGFLGVNIIETKDTFVSADREYEEARIMSLLAGRIAQEQISKNIDSGARSDLKYAKILAKQLIAEFGMDDSEEFRNIYLLDDDLFNEQLAMRIDERANELIRRLYLRTETFIAQHWNILTKMANYLLEKKIVTSDELEQFIPDELK